MGSIELIEDLFSDTVNEEWANYILGLERVMQRGSGGQWWDGSTYTTHDTNAIASGPFDDLLKAATEHVNGLSPEKLKVAHSWANIARKKDRQDYHCHPDSIFSVVYYVKAPIGSSNIVFQESNMNVLEYEAKEGRLLIFNASLRHRVPEGTSTDPRISIAMNFIKEK
tara:strand:+ start:63 stop:566 length:504 start_codon:yes stop_codon:yes gene_type:complete